MRALRQGWQLESFAYRSSIGELRYAVNFLADCAARMRLFPAAFPIGGESDDPLPLNEIPDCPPEIIAACTQAMVDLGNGKLAMGGLLHQLSVQITVPGECFLVGQEDPQTGIQDWKVRSVSEIVIYDDKYKLREVPMDPQGILGWVDLDPALTVASRMWVPDPQFRILADSPLKAIMDDCESLLILRRMIRATGRSRLAGRGLLLIPNELSINVPTDDDDTGATDPFMAALTEAMVEPISDEGVASSVVPMIARGPQEALAAVRLIDFASQFDAMSTATRAELVGIIASGMNLPKSIVLGEEVDANHWSLWQISADTFRNHVAPHVVTCVDMLTGAYLRPYIQNCDLPPEMIAEWAQRLVVWYDPTELVTPTDMTATAITAQDAILISDDAARRYMGFLPSDAPTADEFMARLISKQRTWPANLTMGVIHDIDPGLVVPPMVGPPALPGIKPTGVDVGVAPVVPGAAPTDTTTPPAVGAPEAAPAVPSQPGPPPVPITAAGKPKPSAKSLRLSRKLAAIDADLRARLQTAANAAMLRQLEKAGGRLRSKVAKDETLRTRIAMTRNELVASVLTAAIVAETGLTTDQLMGTDWDAFKVQFMDWTAAAQRQALAVAAQLGGLTTEDESVQAADIAMRTGLDAGWNLLSNAMTEMSRSLLYNPDLNSPDVAAFNPDTLVPTGTIRAALGVAGGMDVKDFAVSENGLATVTMGIPVGQVGTGATVSDLLSGAGQGITGYEWVHGPALRPLPCHEWLDGVEFASFDDPVLAPDNNPEWDGFPEVEYLIPGDHVGDSCDFTPLYGDVSDTTADSGDTGDNGGE